ncbi:hypothetical protein N7535_008657 [Penicillium sp. DV-2018c]|nr:hypothetical protein N7461_002418 [Penicillium sp. DV-2018c]KAJ5563493.1 hypothetical protein N7535_008657 [Penicillium sp. DV-2018c]
MAEEGEIRYSFSDWGLSFKSMSDMARHKAHGHGHFYCRGCDLTFSTHQALHMHKVISDRHIACRHCGLELRSKSGLEHHMRHHHTQARQMACAGCGGKYKSASAVIQHIEDMECPVVGMSEEPFDFDSIDHQSEHTNEGGELPAPQPLENTDFSEDSDGEGGAPLHAPFENVEDEELSRETEGRPWSPDGWPGESEDASPPNDTWATLSIISYGILWDHREAIHSSIHDGNLERFRHPNSGRFGCHCGKSFMHVTSFQYHLMMENGKNNECPRCSKKFTDLIALIAHMEARYSGCAVNASDAQMEKDLIDVTCGLAKAYVKPEPYEVELGLGSPPNQNNGGSSIAGTLSSDSESDAGDTSAAAPRNRIEAEFMVPRAERYVEESQQTWL